MGASGGLICRSRLLSSKELGVVKGVRALWRASARRKGGRKSFFSKKNSVGVQKQAVPHAIVSRAERSLESRPHVAFEHAQHRTRPLSFSSHLTHTLQHRWVGSLDALAHNAHQRRLQKEEEGLQHHAGDHAPIGAGRPVEKGPRKRNGGRRRRAHASGRRAALAGDRRQQPAHVVKVGQELLEGACLGCGWVRAEGAERRAPL